MKLDSKSCNANFSKSELASSIVNIIKNAVSNLQNNGVVNIMIQTDDKNSQNSSYVLSEKIVLTTKTTTQKTTQATVQQTTQAVQEATKTGAEEQSQIEDEPDYVELEVNEPI